MERKIIVTNSPEETIGLACGIGGKLKEGDLLALNGDLGAGKTMFVKGIAKALGIEDYQYVNSPSFVILKEYEGKKKLFHFDVYRLEIRGFEETLDYERYFYGEGVTVIEWAERVKELLPETYLGVKIYHEGENKRRFEFSPKGERYREIVDKL